MPRSDRCREPSEHLPAALSRRHNTGNVKGARRTRFFGKALIGAALALEKTIHAPSCGDGSQPSYLTRLWKPSAFRTWIDRPPLPIVPISIGTPPRFSARLATSALASSWTFEVATLVVSRFYLISQCTHCAHATLQPIQILKLSLQSTVGATEKITP